MNFAIMCYKACLDVKLAEIDATVYLVYNVQWLFKQDIAIDNI